jgi:serine/threonine-protein kinase
MVFGRRYRITERIGSGGMADVYKAIDETLGRTVAVKVLHQRYADDPDFVQRFRHEASAAANLSHPAIVNIYDYGVEAGTYYIVMELVRGTDLKQIVKQRGALDPIKVAEYGAQVCAALSVAHGYGIIHRDVKPQNIVLMPDGGIKVMDFGIARAVDSDSTQTGSVLGTAQYVSPEQAQGQKLGPESDLYSLGVVLYELSTGRLPFEGETPVSVALRHVNDIAPTPRSVNPQIPPALEAVILKAMQKDPTRRYRSAEEMRQDLLRVIAGRTVAATPGVGDTTVMEAVGRTGGPAEISRVDTARRGASPWVWVALVAAAILFGLGAAWALGAFSGGTPVPNASGLTVTAARQLIVGAGLTVGSEITSASVSVPKDKVIGTDPTAGTAVAKGQRIDIIVSSGPPVVVVPATDGKSPDEARAALTALGLQVGSEITTSSPTVPKGQVIGTDPPAGTSVASGQPISVLISSGPELVTVPVTIGSSEASAVLALQAHGFSVNPMITREFNSKYDSGIVFKTDPSGKTKAAKGSQVDIWVSKGAEQVTVPVLVPLLQAAAIQKIHDAQLVELVLYTDTTDSTLVGQVQTQDPVAGTKVDIGSTVKIWVYKLP